MLWLISRGNTGGSDMISGDEGRNTSTVLGALAIAS